MPLRFLHSATRELLQWIGVIQKETIVTLGNPGSLADSELRTLPAFCTPAKADIPLPLTYAFRIKTSTGIYSNAFCLLDHILVRHPSLDPNQPSSICLIYKFYHSTISDEILKSLRLLFLGSVASVQNFVSQLCSSQSPIPIPPELGTADFFTALPPPAIGRLLVALLTDTSLIIAGSDLHQVSTLCYGLVSLILPLQWEHLLAPLLPARAIEAVQSPSLFLIGVHSSMLEAIVSFDVESHVLVNLDDRSVDGTDYLPG
jgi:hypothetical protein